MKIAKITLMALSVMAAFACNNQEGKKADDDSATGKPTSEKPIVKTFDKTGQKEVKPCESIVTEILTTSPRYRQLTKGLSKAVVENGGLYFGVSLEGSPNPGQDKTLTYSKTYDFTVYEMYTDRQLNTARFSFNPNSNQLYEQDVVNNQLKPIEYNRNLLLEYEKHCK